MKKVLSLVAVVAFAASFTACKKDHTCSCTGTDGASDFSVTYVKSKKSDAQGWCDDYADTWSTWYSECTLD